MALSERALDLAQDLISLVAKEKEWSIDEARAFLDTLEPGLSGQLLLRYMKGERYQHLKFDPAFPHAKKINAIKSWRQFTGDGLKEAKDMVELAQVQRVPLPGNLSTDDRKALHENLANTGWYLG